MPEALPPGVKRALSIALAMLKASDKFRAEIERRLSERNVAEADAVRALQILDAKRFLDDGRTVLAEIEKARRKGKFAREALAIKLKARGAPESIVEEALAGYGASDELASAREHLSKKLKPNSSPSQAWRFLASRGFPEEVIESAVNEAFPDRD